MTFKEQVLYRAKAVLAGFGIGVVAFLSWIVQNPDTARVLQEIVPAPYAQFVPIVLAGVVATWLVHKVPNRLPTAMTRIDDDDDAGTDISTDTTVVTGLLGAEDGVETGNGR